MNKSLLIDHTKDTDQNTYMRTKPCREDVRVLHPLCAYHNIQN
jgi:hypothetical protein